MHYCDRTILVYIKHYVHLSCCIAPRTKYCISKRLLGFKSCLFGMKSNVCFVWNLNYKTLCQKYFKEVLDPLKHWNKENQDILLWKHENRMFWKYQKFFSSSPCFFFRRNVAREADTFLDRPQFMIKVFLTRYSMKIYLLYCLSASTKHKINTTTLLNYID